MPVTEGTGAIIISFDKNAISLKNSGDSVAAYLGSVNSRYRSTDAIQSYSERNTTKIGCDIGFYDPELQAILAGALG